MAHTGGRAIVIGASMGGLLAARALSDHFERVTILERDDAPDSTEPRKGVPQGRHSHGLLARGSRTLEALFPGFRDDIAREGGIFDDIADKSIWYNFGVTLKSGPSEIYGYLVSRPALENAVRRRVRSLANVELLDRCDVEGLETDGERRRVTGVRVRSAHAAEGSRRLAADLVVDAGGRAAQSPRWLAELGYPTPTEESVDVGITYMTRTYRRQPGHIPGKAAVILAACPPDWRVGVLLAQENDRWTVSLGGYFGDKAVADNAGFLAFARSLPRREIYDVIRDAEPLSDPTPYRFQASLRRRYERLSRFPEGYLAFGDALCSFNPIYGQGMSVACVEAMALGACLGKGADRLAQRFFKMAASAIDVPWQIAVGSDLMHPQVVGPRPAPVRFINWYVGKLHRAAENDADLANRFLEVANLLKPPPSLFAPKVVGKVLRGHLFGAASTRARALANPPEGGRDHAGERLSVR